MNHSDIRGSKPHDDDSSGAASLERREFETGVIYRIKTVEDSPFDVGRSDHWVSAAQRKPVSSRATAVTICCLGFPRAAEKRMVAVLPGGFDEDPPEMGVAGFGNGASGLFRPAGLFGGDQTGQRHDARCRRETAGIAQFGGNGQGGEIIDAAETPQPFDARAQRLERGRRSRNSALTACKRPPASLTARTYA
jgi:hypothetical protein